jgi:hypothetical protein
MFPLEVSRSKRPYSDVVAILGLSTRLQAAAKNFHERQKRRSNGKKAAVPSLSFTKF